MVVKSSFLKVQGLEGKTVIVTGSGRGIGAAIAIGFARAGSRIIAIDLKEPSTLLEGTDGADAVVVPVALDITRHKIVISTISELVLRYGPPDILINNAGIIARGTIEDLTYQDWLSVLDVNLNGVFNMCKAVIPHMKKRKSGTILNITSIAGKMGDITAAPVYGASKGAVNTLTRSLARQLAVYNIRVNAIAPHAVNTDMSASWSPDKRRSVIESIPLKRLAQPSEIADAALFLASDNASFITGEILNINGGTLMD